MNVGIVIVEQMVEDMKQRNGFKQLWDSLDEEVIEEIYMEWIGQVESTIRERLFDE